MQPVRHAGTLRLIAGDETIEKRNLCTDVGKNIRVK